MEFDHYTTAALRGLAIMVLVPSKQGSTRPFLRHKSRGHVSTRIAKVVKQQSRHGFVKNDGVTGTLSSPLNIYVINPERRSMLLIPSSNHDFVVPSEPLWTSDQDSRRPWCGNKAEASQEDAHPLALG